MQKTSRTLFSLFALVLLVTLSSACDDSTSHSAATSPAEDPESIIFPVQGPTNNVMEALIEGTLTVQEGCLYLSARGPGGLVLPIWPQGFSYEHTDGEVSVLNAENEVVAETGVLFTMGGGMSGEGPGNRLPSELKDEVRGCKRPYWIVGNISEPS